MAIKEVTAYRAWFWMDLFGQAVAMIVFLYFWRAVYDQTSDIAGLDLDTTLNYILIVRVLAGVTNHNFLRLIRNYLREGRIAIELLRPVDFQTVQFANSVAHWVMGLGLRVPLLLLALALGLELPNDPLRYIAFLVSFTLGACIMFLFDWIAGCLAFYTTEVWGIAVMLSGVQLFFSGTLVPLDMLPPALQRVAQLLPFKQAVYSPVSLLSGIEPVSSAPGIWAVQIIWILGLWILSRIAFRRSVRAVTVQGG